MKNLFLREEVKIGPKLGFLSFSQVFLDIVQDSSLGQCLTSSGAETSKKIVAQIGAKMIFSILVSSSIQSNLLVFLVFFA